jgi:hypothetical protein
MQPQTARSGGGGSTAGKIDRGREGGSVPAVVYTAACERGSERPRALAPSLYLVDGIDERGVDAGGPSRLHLSATARLLLLRRRRRLLYLQHGGAL